MEFLKLSRAKLLNLILLCLVLNGCSLLDPFVDRRREAGAKDEAHLYVGASKPDAPAICYNKWTTDFETLQKRGIRRQVETTMIYPVSFDFWQVRFDIIETGPELEKPIISHWIATMRMKFEFAKFDNKDLGLINPFGITITTYDLSYMGNNIKSKRD